MATTRAGGDAQGSESQIPTETAGKECQPGNAFPAMDGHTPGVHRIAHVSTLLFSDIGLSLIHHYWVHKRGLPHVATIRKLYVAATCSAAPAYGSSNRGGGSPDPACSSLPCAVESPDVVCASPRPSRRAIGRRRLIRFMEPPVRIAPRLMMQDPLAAAGAVVLDCRPPLLTGAMDVSGIDLAEIQSLTKASVADTVPPEREQSFGGEDLLSLICPELGVTPRFDPGTDLEDELSTPANSPAADDHGVVSLSAQADIDLELEQVFGDVGSLPAMVTPVCDLDGLRMTPAECPVREPSGVSVVVTQPLMVNSPQPSTGVGGLFVSASDVPGGVHAGGDLVAPDC